MSEPAFKTSLKNWKEQLKKFRQPWPEWKQLEDLVSKLKFEQIHEPYLTSYYLVSDLIDDKFYLSHKIPISEYEEDLKNEFLDYPDIIPSYFIPLLDLKIIQTLQHEKSKESIVAYSGGIGGSLSYEKMTWIKEKNEIGMIEPYPNPWDGSIPNNQKLFVLQSTISGTDFLCSTNKEVYVISNDFKKYLKIGKLENFIRWCLKMNLEKQNWHNGYFDKLYFDQYNLNYQDTWMD